MQIAMNHEQRTMNQLQNEPNCRPVAGSAKHEVRNEASGCGTAVCVGLSAGGGVQRRAWCVALPLGRFLLDVLLCGQQGDAALHDIGVNDVSSGLGLKRFRRRRQE